MGDQLLSSAGAGGTCARTMRLPDSSPVLDKNRAETIGSFLLTVELFCLRLCLAAFFTYDLSLFTYNWSFFSTVGAIFAYSG